MRNLRFCCAFYFPEPSESIALRASEEQSQQLSVILLPASRLHMTFYAKPSHGFHPFITSTRSQQLTANAIVIQCKRCGDFLKDWIIEYSIEQVNSRHSSLCEELDNVNPWNGLRLWLLLLVWYGAHIMFRQYLHRDTSQLLIFLLFQILS